MLRWFARNDIAANFLMLAILFAGVYSAFFRIPLEVRPSIEIKSVRVSMPFRGASPQDVERTIAIPIERALEGMSGVESIETESRSGRCNIAVYAEDGIDLKELKTEVETRVNAIATFPTEAERPTFRIPNSQSWWEVMTIAVTGELDDHELREAAYQVRDEMLSLPGISQVEVIGDKKSEISIEAEDKKLIDYGLSFADIAQAIRNHSVDLSAGSISSQGGSLMLRTKGQAFTAKDFQSIPLRAENGASITIGDVAKVTDGFEQNQKVIRFNGRRALLVELLRADGESAIEISNTARQYVEDANKRLPDGLSLYAWDDDSIALRGRLGTLGISLLQGSLLVLLVLGLFLRPSLAFWVVMGIPISFAGGLLMMPTLGVTGNLMSVFGFIIVLGIVVDDAIVTGENIYSKLRMGMNPEDAAVLGAKEVATPVTFGVLTTIVAFIPLMYFDGWWGNFTRQIPPIVAPVLVFSLIESKLILPAHLKHLKTGREKVRGFAKMQKMIADGLERFIEKVYQPVLRWAVDNRAITLSILTALGFATVGLIQGGKMGFVTMPSVDRYMINARIQMADDTPFEITQEKVDFLVEKAEILQKEFVDSITGDSLITHIMSSAGGWPSRRSSDPETGIVAMEIMPPSQRSERGPDNKTIAKRWRELVGDIPGARQFHIRTETSGGRNSQVESMEIQLRGPDSERKREIAKEIRELLKSYDGISSTWDNARNPRDELLIALKPRAVELGITQRDLARQVRQAFFGEQAQRIQRDRDDIRVMVRLPEEQRESLHTLDTLKIRLRDGSEVPFRSIAELERGLSPSRIDRIDGAQAMKIVAQPEDDSVDIIAIAESIKPRIDELVAGESGLSWRFEGFIAEHRETGLRIAFSVLGLCLALYALLAIPFKSLLQPVFVMMAIPFGVMGALIGHLIMDITPSYLSVFGMLALAGVVVNDSLVMVDFINTKRLAGGDVRAAVLEVGANRFRPIMLTSLTTFAGLMPLIFDTSLQAQFLIPMAVSLAFGIVFATGITLFLIPCAYLALEDVKEWFVKPFRKV